MVGGRELERPSSWRIKVRAWRGGVFWRFRLSAASEVAAKKRPAESRLTPAKIGCHSNSFPSTGGATVSRCALLPDNHGTGCFRIAGSKFRLNWFFFGHLYLQSCWAVKHKIKVAVL